MHTILLVDDSPVARRVIARQLADAGFEVCEAASSAGARRVDPAAVACAVLDLDLGDGDGTDLAALLLARRASLPIAFFTAGGSPSLVERARAHGPVFSKQGETGKLVDWVKRATRTQPPPTK